ncbi:hypothetical protein LMH87_009446 [Akanthomyces muscarius]|uniref:Uncharacterized protein n=1 Tax=Akanthomyces muscarius TaxID=2231603 RepID=A0A9W8QBC7_AKAMU|nr:hypothetical protein LMH87_009446 [Akanthomyces muscarius]KAJ4152928.1 hypothetical protein LMH87_009446 [Akanthomyces muscarius]
MAEQLLRQKQWLLLVKHPFRIGSLCSTIIWWLFSLIIHKANLSAQQPGADAVQLPSTTAVSGCAATTKH